MEIGQLVWFCWWKGHFPNADGQSDLIRKAALILGEYEAVDNTEDMWYDIYVFEDNRRLIVDEVKLEKINRGEE
jgi:hypothetical protein|tara:strand:+ start:7682 stop:7903 length:222 start_codon:yes stop_codon:yes gene_type:complete